MRSPAPARRLSPVTQEWMMWLIIFFTNPINLSGKVELMSGDRLPFLSLFLPWAAAQKLAVHCICQRCSPANSFFFSLYKNPVLETTVNWKEFFFQWETMRWGVVWRGLPSAILPASRVPDSQSSAAAILPSTAVTEKAAMLAIRHIVIPVAHSSTYRAASHTLNHSWILN